MRLTNIHKYAIGTVYRIIAMKRKDLVLSVLFLVGALVSMIVFAQVSHDNTEHQKSRSHIHWFTDHSAEGEVQWTVEVGKMDWNGLST